MEKTLEELIDEQGVLLHRTTGSSMAPLLHTGDSVAIVKHTGRLKKYDVPLYKRKDKYILHRVVKVRERDYVICGDNCLSREYGVTDRDILGVAAVFYRNGKEIHTEQLSYRLYARVRTATFPLRVLLHRVRSFLGRWKRKLLKKQ